MIFTWWQRLRWIWQARPTRQLPRRTRPQFEFLEARDVPATHTWNPGGESNLRWSNPSNWIGGAPAIDEQGIVLVFPVSGDLIQLSSIADIDGLAIDQITLADDYVIEGLQDVQQTIQVSFTGAATAIVSNSSNPSFGNFLNLTINGVATFQVDSGTLDILCPMEGPGDLVKTGAGTATLAGPSDNTYAGLTRVNAGTLVLNVSEGVAVPNGLIIGDSQGGLAADQVVLFTSEQIADTAQVTVNSSGALQIPTGVTETISTLIMTGGLVHEPPGGATLILRQNVENSLVARSDPEGNPAVIDASLSLEGTFQNITVADGPGFFDLVISGSVGGGGFVKFGAGTMVLSGSNAYTGGTIVEAGVLLVNGIQTGSPITVDSGILGGTGTVGVIRLAGSGTFENGGVLNPGSSPGLLTAVGDVALNAPGRYVVELQFLSLADGYDVLRVNGALSLGARLDVLLGFAPGVGSQFRIIENDGSDQILGTFDGLAEGSFFQVNGVSFQITYRGGDGNDVVLTRADPPAPPPGDAIQRYVTALYRDVLFRSPDLGGFQFWVGVLRTGSLTRFQVSNQFLISQEKQGLVVEQFYRQILGRPSDPGSAFWINALVTGALTDSQVVVGFVTSTEFTNRYPSNRAYVTEIYRVLLDRPFGTSQAEINQQTRILDLGLETRGQMALVFLSSNEAYVKAIVSLYRTYLNRDPSGQELQNRLIQFQTLPLTPALVQASFLGSDEFFILVTT